MADISVTFTSGRLGKSNFRRQLFVTPHIIAGLGLKPADHPTYKVYIANFPPDKDGDDPSGADQHNLDAPESQQLSFVRASQVLRVSENRAGLESFRSRLLSSSDRSD